MSAQRGTVKVGKVGGKERSFRLDLNALVEIQEHLGAESFGALGASFDKMSFAQLRYCFVRALQWQDPDLTEEDLGSWDINIEEWTTLFFDAWGLAMRGKTQAQTTEEVVEQAGKALRKAGVAVAN